jgi:IPT/TIG domain
MMRWEVRSARAVVVIIGIGAALGASACADSSPSSPSDSSGTTTTVLYTPKVTAMEPSTGADAGGTVVTITGEHFSTAAVVKIGGASASAVVFISDTTLQATTPAGTAGPADVVVTVGSLSGTLKSGFSYLGATDCAMTFTVYNHTAGKLGSWTATLPSGATVTLAIGALGEVVDEDGNIVQAAIPIDSVDSLRMVVRTGAVNGRVGDFVVYSTTGSASFQVPVADRASYDVFVLNAQNGTDYSVVDRSTLAYDRTTTISRGTDIGGTTGPDDAVDVLVQALSEAVTYPWMSYGRVARTAGDGSIFLIYTQPNAGACVTYTRSTGMLYVNPARCAAVPVELYGSILENGIEMLAGVRDIGGPDSAGLLDWDALRLTPTGRDLLAYVYLKDSKGW